MAVAASEGGGGPGGRAEESELNSVLYLYLTPDLCVTNRKHKKHSVISNTAVTKQDILEIFRFLIWKLSKINSYNHCNEI